MKLRSWASALTLAFSLEAGAIYAQSPQNLVDISLEDLLLVEVTSVSRKEEALFRAPSAIAVVTGEDIRRAGVTTIPEALRLVPGLQVASIDGNRWAVSARGFNSLFANKLLVLIDGRSIYTATYSGVHWDMQDVSVEDIERIEVIRGPGAALWGANAVNGVINVITKAARLTQGGAVALSGGSLDRGSGSVRYGGRAGTDSFYRLFAKYQNIGRTKPYRSGDPADDWQVGHVGFRVDAQLSADNSLFATAVYSQGEIGRRQDLLSGVLPSDTITSRDPVQAKALSGLLRWDRGISPTSDMSVQATFDETHRDEQTIQVKIDVVNIDFQHHFAAGRHNLVWGAGQRVTVDRANNTFALSITPADERVLVTNAFLQDEISLVPSVVSLTAGSKFEYSSLSGGSVQPNVRVSVSPTTGQNIWGAVSHAVRTPSRVELGVRFNYASMPGPGLPILVSAFGNPDLKPEHVTAFEAGYRIQPAALIQIDATAFHNRYRDLTHVALNTFVETTPAPMHLVAGLRFVNEDRAETQGVETLVRVQPLRRWMLEASHTLFTATFYDEPQEGMSPRGNAGSPSHQWQLKSRLTLPANVELDASLFHVGELEAAAPAYSRLDVRLGWTLRGIGLSLVGQNLLEPDHLEFDDIGGSAGSLIPRTAAAKVTWQF